MREMKDSGIEWIGEIPKDWGIIATKYCFTVNNGSDPTTNGGNTPVYGSGSKSFKTCVEYKEGPTVLLGRKGTVNIPQWVMGRYWNVDTAFDVKPKGNYNLKFFYYAATCFDYENYSTQTALPSMTQGNYLNMKLPYMPLPEQHRIADFLDAKCADIDAATNFVQKKGEEHKSANLVADPVVKLPTAEHFGLTEDKEQRLFEIIDEINSRTGKNYDNDVVVKSMLQIRDILMKSDKLKTSARNNTQQDFEFSYFDDIDDALIEGLSQNQDFFSMLLSNDEMKRQVLGIFSDEIYKSLRNVK